MSTAVHIARQILGDDMIGLDEIRMGFGDVEGVEDQAQSVPFSTADLEAAKHNDEILILRAAACGGESITMRWFIERFPDAFDPATLRKVGYQLKDDWGIELEPLAATETCRPQWALVRKGILDATRNLSYDEQDEHLQTYAGTRRAADRVRRRAAIEIVFDLLATHRAGGGRLLRRSWDWSRSRTVDGGYLNVGRFTEQGMQIFSYSRAVRHGELGVCPNIDPSPR